MIKCLPGLAAVGSWLYRVSTRRSRRHVGERFAVSTLYRVLAHRGWRKRAPDTAHPQGDASRREAFKKLRNAVVEVLNSFPPNCVHGVGEQWKRLREAFLNRSTAPRAPLSTLPQRRHAVLLRRDWRQRADFYAQLECTARGLHNLRFMRREKNQPGNSGRNAE